MDQVIQSEVWKRVFDYVLEWCITSGPSLFIIILVGFVGQRAARFLLHNLEEMLLKQSRDRAKNPEGAEKRIKTLSGLLRSTVRVLIWFVVFMLVLKELGVDIAPILAGAGVIGLAVGFGAQNLVRDVITGFFMLLEDQIRTGDVAIINGTGGLVESINLRTTVLRDLSGVVHIFPNGTINTVANMTKEWSAMVFDIGVAYKEDVDHVMDVMKEVADELGEDPKFKDLILAPIEIFGLDEFGDNAVVIKARLKTKPIQQWAVGREYRRRLKRVFDEKGIEIPFPQRTLHMASGVATESLVDLKKTA